MTTFKLRETDEFIKMGQVIKAVGFVESGVDAKDVILQGLVTYNGEVCTMRGKKCYPGDQIGFEGQTVTIER